MLVFIMMAVGLNIVVGYAGLLDLGYVAFYAMGAYTAAWLASTQFAGAKCPKSRIRHQRLPGRDRAGGRLQLRWRRNHARHRRIRISIWVILAAAELFDRADRGAHRPADAAPARRLPGDRHPRLRRDPAPRSPATGTNLRPGFNLTGGPRGDHTVDSPGFGNNLSNWDRRFPAPRLPDQRRTRDASSTGRPSRCSPVTVFCSIRLRDSRLGRAWIAIREDEVAASAMGIPLMRTKTWAYPTAAPSLEGSQAPTSPPFKSFDVPAETSTSTSRCSSSAWSSSAAWATCGG